MRSSTSPLAAWAGLVVLYLVWGSTYLGIRIAVETMPPLLMAAGRFIAAGSILSLAVAIRSRATIKRPSRVEVRDSAIVGTFLLLGGMGLVAVGERTVPSGIAALMVALMPMWLAVFARVVFGDRLSWLGWTGVVIGIAGVAILAWPVTGVAAIDPGGLAVLTASPMFWAMGTLYSAKKAVRPSPILFATGLEMLAGGLVLAVVATLSGEVVGFDPGTVSTASWLGLAYLVGIGSLVGYTTFAWLLTVSPLPRVTTYAYVNPVVAVVLGAIVLHEPLSGRTGIASIVIVVAVVLIVTARGRASRAEVELEADTGTPVAEV